MIKKKVYTLLFTTALTGAILTGCSTANQTSNSSDSSTAKSSTVESSSTSEQAKENSIGAEYTSILSSTNWQGTVVKDAKGNDLTKENAEFIGLAKYDAKTGYYEFFDKETGETRGDEGTFFVTNDGTKRILISTTKNYQAVVELTEVSDELFTYKRMGKDKEGNDIEVFVQHVPYDKELSFTKGREDLTAKTGTIETKTPGDTILGNTLWNGTKVYDEDGNDLTEENNMFISLAKFDDTDNKYEFFDIESGESRGDFGYFKVIDNNKIRAHVSIGENKYGVALEMTELNDKKFTYKRLGKDKDGNEVTVFVEHEPYSGDHSPAFTF
ncbi:DUF4822 domain-containing protein [Vagococcus martis]|uniref:DUF4822 domain-containing protein n=1 Tax=Vagococcus martis TaxID=1768210 RepID=A0A1V4DFZ9_9ENTE|nr:DUF4822 domain-containing protein [Vagococcus martis]OPF87474.1 DUF4822 domain-containing protein [Vagococcus martis]